MPRGNLVIFINGREYQPLKKIASSEQLLKLADLDVSSNEIFFLDERGKKFMIESEEGIELQGGMRFLTQPR